MGEKIKQIADNYHSPLTNGSIFTGTWICTLCQQKSSYRHELQKDKTNEKLEVCFSCLLKIFNYWNKKKPQKISPI